MRALALVALSIPPALAQTCFHEPHPWEVSSGVDIPEGYRAALYPTILGAGAGCARRQGPPAPLLRTHACAC
jgi:hypothetical protein